MSDDWNEHKEFRGKLFAALIIGSLLAPWVALVMYTVMYIVAQLISQNLNIVIPMMCIATWIVIAIVANNEQERET